MSTLWWGSQKNLRSPERHELKQANNEWAECISKNFLPQWLKGEDVSAEGVCAEPLARMQEADEAVYSENPMPRFKNYEQ